MKKILIVEDESGLRVTLEDRLRAEGYEVVSKADGPRGEEAARQGVFDLIILDIMLPGRDGFAVCQNLRKGGIATPILMLTARNGDLDTVMGLRQGADDYLGKPFDMGVLIARMEALIRRAPRPVFMEKELPKTVSFGPFVLDRERGALLFEGKSIDLHAQEYRLLSFMTAKPGRTLTREEMLDQVWGYGTETATRTVDMHIARLRKRLREPEIPKYIRTVRGLGYRFEP